MKRVLWSLLLTLALAFALPALAAQGKGQGNKPADKGKPAEAGKPDDKGKKDDIEDRVREEMAKRGRAFGKDHEKTIRDWFGNNENLQGLPPGLAKREQLPPGLQRHLEKNGTLPPGLQKKVQPLPESLDKKLPKTPDDVKRVVVAGNVILLEKRTSKILDIVKDVLPGKSSGDSGTTGVRRN